MPEVIKDRKCCQTCKTSGDKKLSKCAKCHAVSYCGKECQRQDWPRHSHFCYPVQITCIPRMRLGLVAARNFKKGERIFVDRAAVSVEMKGKIDKKLVDDLKKEIQNLSEEEKSLFYKLKETEMHDEDHHLCWVNNIGKEENYLEELKIFLGNQIDEKLFLKLSLVNHSCSPNATDDMGFGFDCLCAVCSGEKPHQDDIKEKLLDLKSYICRENNHTKRILDWKSEAMCLSEMVDLVQRFNNGRIEIRNHIYADFATRAHMARDPTLRKKAFDLWKTLVEETGLWQIRGHYEEVQSKLDKWSSEFKSKKHPRKEEVDAIFGK